MPASSLACAFRSSSHTYTSTATRTRRTTRTMAQKHHDDRWSSSATLLTIDSPSSMADAAARAGKLIIIGTKDAILAPGAMECVSSNEDVTSAARGLAKSLESGASRSTALNVTTDDELKEVVVCIIPSTTEVSRHNSPISSHTIAASAKSAIGDRKKRSACVVTILANDEFAASAISAMARIVPPYANKFRASGYVADGDVHIGVVAGGAVWNGPETRSLPKALRRCQTLVDSAPNELDPNTFVDEAKRVAVELGASVKIVEIKRFTQLESEGYGMLAGVGRASTRDGREPALVHLRFMPKGCTDPNAPSIAFVGKGITFDTGGLSLKSKDGMCGMKTDMGGAAGMFGAFEAIATENADEFKTPLDLVLCIAENAIGSGAIRPDDILVAKSGKTVEINNTDAEGRLVLGDGVAYCTDPENNTMNPKVIIDMATLTGAQMIATGRKHAGLVCDNEDMETLLVKLGKTTGDLVHPLPYAPEMFKSEFSSKVADMKNSVADRANAQSSCAGQFIANHLNEEWSKREDTRWAHIDMAGPGNLKDGLATGYGVTLLHALYKTLDARGL